MRGALKFIERGPAARVCRRRTICICWAIWPTRRPKRPRDRARYVAASRNRDRAAARRASFRLGREKFEQKLAARGRAVACRSIACWRSRTRELQDDAGGVQVASPAQMNGGEPAAGAGRATKARPSGARRARPRRRRAARRAQTRFSSASRIVSLPPGRADHRGADARLLSLVVRQHVDAGALRDQADARLLLPDRRRSGVAAPNAAANTCATTTTRRSGRSRSTRSIRATSCTISICAGSSRRSRKSILFAPASFVEGWAHYCEQMMIEAGFGRQRLRRQARPACRSAHPPRPLHRRHQAARRGSVGRAGRPVVPRRGVHGRSERAPRSAERGTFDPTYLVYSAGKLMLLKLRQDYKQQQGKAFSLRTFHDTLLGNGTAPFWLHRQLMLGDDRRRRDRIKPTMPLRIPVRRVRSPLRDDSEVFRSAGRDVSRSAAARFSKLISASGVSAQGERLVHHRLRAEGSSGARRTRARRRNPKESGKIRRTATSRERAPKQTDQQQRVEWNPSRNRASDREAQATARPRRRRLTPRGAPPRPELLAETACRPASADHRGEIRRELLRQIGPPQREVDHRLQESELVAGVVADAFHFAGVDRPRFQQLAQAVRQLDLAGPVALGGAPAPGRCPA